MKYNNPQTNADKVGFMRGLTDSLVAGTVPPQEIEGEALAPELPQTLESALQMIAALQEENAVLKQQLGMSQEVGEPSTQGMEVPPTV